MNSRSFQPFVIYQQKRGVALVLILSCVVLIALLLVSFLSMVKSDQQSSSAFAESVEARTLTDLPINLAIGQIRRGTEQLGYQKTWASQPGMIRTYGLENDGSNQRSRSLALYKLYSDDKMVVTNAGAVTATAGGLTREQVEAAINEDIAELSSWDTKPGLYVDLNEPVPVKVTSSGNVTLEFPIADPRALTPPSGEPVAGFNFADDAIPKALRPTSSADYNTRLPMPVKWIYVLKDGQFTTPTSADAIKAEFKGNVVPTVLNPIVGRIAFWADDDSCKVNVNTASEGSPWYPPVANTETDRKFAERLPAQNEFARAPGHPAQTSLSPVFQAFGDDFVMPPDLSNSELATRTQFYHDLNPRVRWGGTKGGTTTATAAIAANKVNRFYSTLDELLFTPNRDRLHPDLDSNDLALGRFFLTTHSWSPEQSQFNKIRLGLWPLWREGTERTARDNLIDLVTSAGVRGGGVGFDRGAGWAYSRNYAFKSVSSRGGSQEISGATSDYSENLRTWTITDGVLAQYMGTPVTGGSTNYVMIPGFGNQSFLQKYGRAKRDQIMIEMIDLLRWSVNSFRPVSGSMNSYLPPQNASKNPNRLGEYSAVPISTHPPVAPYPDPNYYSASIAKNARGFGRWPTITEAALVFMGTQKAAGGDPADPNGNASHMQAFLILEPFSPVVGPPAWSANVRYKIEGLDTFTFTPTGKAARPLGFPAAAINKVNFPPSLMEGGNKSPFPGLLSQFAKADTLAPTVLSFVPKIPGGTNEVTNFPFTSQEVSLEDQTSFAFSGGTITIKILTGWEATEADAKTVQTLTLTFPGTTLNAPAFRNGDFGIYNSLPARLSQLKSPSGHWQPNVLIRDGDIVRSMEASHVGPAKGDLRFIAALQNVPSTFFVATNGYNTNTNEITHSLRDGAWISEAQQFFSGSAPKRGNLIKDLIHPASIQPSVPSRLNGALNANGKPGDWDNGIGLIEDGPYVNRADEGSAWFGTDGGYFSRGSDSVGAASLFERTVSPHRQVSSAMIFGALPTGIDPSGADLTQEPWQTLLFCPNPASRSTAALDEPVEADHKGFASPRDHLILDFFCMPTVEPFAMSESLASAGKINMNYELMPFTYLERSTGIHAVLKATRVTAVSRGSLVSDSGHYKDPAVTHNSEIRYLVNAEETMKGFKNRFDNKHDLFRAASEICEIFLVPERMPGASYASDAPTPGEYKDMTTWWNGSNPGLIPSPFDVTGDNLREAPYNDLYPRLTTKSNVFTVHYRVQTLSKARSTNVAEWVEEKDARTSERRGSATLERYMDPNNFELASINQGGGSFTQTWDTFQRFRITQRKEFNP